MDVFHDLLQPLLSIDVQFLASSEKAIEHSNVLSRSVGSDSMQTNCLWKLSIVMLISDGF